MEHQTTKLTPLQSIGIYWLQKIDSQLLLYKQLISLPQALRLFLYPALIGFTYFALKFVASIIGGYFDTAPMPEAWYFLGDIVFYGVIIGTFLMPTIESLNSCDVSQIFADKKARAANIKTQKLQKWRLRNMNIFFRILIYIFFYMFLVFIFQLSFIGLMIDITQTTTLTQEQIQALNDEYVYILRWFTFIYLLAALALDYRVIKKIRAVKAQKEVQNEVINA